MGKRMTGADYGPVFQEVFSVRAEMPLVSGTPLPVPELTVDTAFAHHEGALNESFARACLAAAYLYADHWDTAHRIAQDLPTREGSYWHAIIHRREPDYWNSKYWFRQVGSHPVYPALARAVQEQVAGDEALLPFANMVAQGENWDAFRFVDLCEEAARKEGPLKRFCLAVQQQEFFLLFDYCYQHATQTAGR